MFPGMEQLLPLLLGENAFGGPGGPGGLGDAPAPGAGNGLVGELKQAAGAMQAVNPPQGQKPIMSGGVSGVQLPFLQQANDMVTPALNAMAARRNAAPQLPTMAQLLGR